ncbi:MULTISPECIES: hypothetical protein [Bradyrhizobium]|uniref:hypothetical protein n=1 Tax=Bradyrhizobium TaxID=374 RepID=UPI001EDAB396|nr:hypothetical protein [Bradyrhizobium zhengyangense]MCG2643766.1 hypothetical protein [Bradyrhizobium zhengyangense]
MVSEFPKTRKPRSSLRRAKPGPPKRTNEENRSERITLRAHDDLMRILTLRADESGFSRSHYIERILIAYLRLDPRNPNFDAMGRFKKSGTMPFDLFHNDKARVGERWAKFSTVHENLFGMAPPRDWLDDESGFWPGTDVVNGYEEDSQGD